MVGHPLIFATSLAASSSHRHVSQIKETVMTCRVSLLHLPLQSGIGSLCIERAMLKISMDGPKSGSIRPFTILDINIELALHSPKCIRRERTDFRLFGDANKRYVAFCLCRFDKVHG